MDEVRRATFARLGIILSQAEPETKLTPPREEIRRLQAKYDLTAWFYDILDFPWELQYRRWRPVLLEDVRGNVLEAGVGTGRNLRYYPPEASVTGIDLCQGMLSRAAKRGRHAVCHLVLCQEDVTTMASISSNQFD